MIFKGAIFFVFFLFQLYIFFSLRKQWGLIAQEWKHWYEINKTFKTSQELLARLHYKLYENISYKVLIRLEGAAPYLGVVVGTWSFITVTQNTSPDKLNTTFVAIQSVCIGVLCGSMLSLINRVLVSLAQRRSGTLYEKIEAEILPTQHELSNAEIKMQQFAENLGRVGAGFDGAMNKIFEAIEETSTQITQRIENLCLKIDDTAAKLETSSDKITQSTSKFYDDLLEVVPHIQQVLEKILSPVNENTSVIAETCKTMSQVCTELNSVLQNTKDSSSDLVTVCKKLETSSDNFAEGSSEFLRSTRSLGEKQTKIAETFEECLQNINNTTSETQDQMQDLVDNLGTLNKDLRETTTVFHETSENFQSSAQKFHEDMNRVSPAIEAGLAAIQPPIKKAGDCLQKSVDQFGEISTEIKNNLNKAGHTVVGASKGIEESLGRMIGVCMRVKESGDLLYKASGAFVTSASEFRKKLTELSGEYHSKTLSPFWGTTIVLLCSGILGFTVLCYLKIII